VLIKDKLAVVTGGARRVGRAIVEGLAGEGARVVIHCHRSRAEAEQLAREVGGLVVQADLAAPDGARELASQVKGLAPAGALAAWVNCAATFERRPFLEGDDALWADTVQLVLLSAASCIRQVAPVMAKGGVVINVLDVAAHQPWRGYAHHCVAKAALLMLTRCLALELAPDLRVCAVSPGVVLPPEGTSPEELAQLVRRIPLARIGSPGDVAEAVRYLVRADFVSGAVIDVDGGAAARGTRGPW
jgi:pteridine reductase